MDKKLQRKASLIQAVRKHSAAISDKSKELLQAESEDEDSSYSPEAINPFKPEPVFAILEEVMCGALDGATYDPEACADLAMSLSADIRTRVKALNFDRYKLICTVEIIEKSGQGIRMIAQYLWDHEKDNYAFYKFENCHLVGVAYVFGVYYK